MSASSAATFSGSDQQQASGCQATGAALAQGVTEIREGIPDMESAWSVVSFDSTPSGASCSVTIDYQQSVPYGDGTCNETLTVTLTIPPPQ